MLRRATRRWSPPPRRRSRRSRPPRRCRRSSRPAWPRRRRPRPPQQIFVQIGAFARARERRAARRAPHVSGFANPIVVSGGRRPPHAAPRAARAVARRHRVRSGERAAARARRFGESQLVVDGAPMSCRSEAVSSGGDDSRFDCATDYAARHGRGRGGTVKVAAPPKVTASRATTSSTSRPAPCSPRATPTRQLAPASLTKLMTAYVVFRRARSRTGSRLDDRALVSTKAWRMGGTRMFIEVNFDVGSRGPACAAC